MLASTTFQQTIPCGMPDVPHLAKPLPVSAHKEEDGGATMEDEHDQLFLSLPKERGWRTRYLYKFQGFWCQSKEIQAIISFQKHFRAMDGDIFIATIPKSGTTWLKALAFAVVNRAKFPVGLSPGHPLFTSNPHDLVPFLEYRLYADNNVPNLSQFPQPRMFASHVPYPCLKKSIQNSDTKIVYLCRNPFDTFISSWHYTNKISSKSVAPISLDEAFDLYCKGIVGFGPFWEHMLGYWKESLEKPDEVLFLKYEDLKDDIASNLKKLADFLGYPFSEEEERRGIIEGIAEMCSFESLKEVEVNKSGKSIKNFENKHLFRKGEVSDWVNYLSPSQAETLSRVIDDKLAGSGLTFRTS